MNDVRKYAQLINKWFYAEPDDIDTPSYLYEILQALATHVTKLEAEIAELKEQFKKEFESRQFDVNVLQGVCAENSWNKDRLVKLEAEIVELKAVGYKTKPTEPGAGGSGNVYDEAGNVLQENKKSVSGASYEEDEDRVISSNRIRTKANNYQFTPVRFASYDEACIEFVNQMDDPDSYSFKLSKTSEGWQLDCWEDIREVITFMGLSKQICIEKAFEYYNWKII